MVKNGTRRVGSGFGGRKPLVEIVAQGDVQAPGGIDIDLGGQIAPLVVVIGPVAGILPGKRVVRVLDVNPVALIHAQPA